MDNFLTALWHHVHPDQEEKAGELYQTSLMSALMSGVYDGTKTIAQLATHGDFGLGTFNDLDGEMAVLDGNFYQFKGDGKVVIAGRDQKTPFAAVTFFKPERMLRPKGKLTKAELTQVLEGDTQENLFTAIRVDAYFPKLTVRVVKPQHRPFPTLDEAAKMQYTVDLSEREGSLVGFRTPAYAQGLGVAGYHLHFLDAAREHGGHMMDCVLEGITITLCSIEHLHIDLPTTADFKTAHMKSPVELEESIMKAEG